jgi:hypothetical protein
MLLYSVSAISYSYNYTTALVTVCNSTPNLNITSFYVDPSSPYSDEHPVFRTVFKNEGNCYLMNATQNIMVYNSAGIKVWNSSPVNDPNVVAETITGPTDFFTAPYTFPADTYTANLTINYTVQDFYGVIIFNNSTKANLSFTTTIRPVTPPSTGGGGGGALPPSIPKAIFVQFQKYPVLQEVAPGSLIIVDLGVKNPENKVQSISVNFTGIPSNWMTVFQKDITIDPYALKTISFTLNVPENADSGDYLVKASIQDKGISGYSYFIVRVKSYPDNYMAPQMYRRVDLDFVNNKSTVKILVWNDASPHKKIDIYEKIPKMIADNVDQVSFATAPNAIIQADPVVMFTMDNVRPEEKRSIDYTVNNVIDQYEPYVYWPIEQVNVMYEKGVDKIQISNVYQSILIPGGRDNYLTFDIGNIYTSNVNVTITSWLPRGWNTTPASINLVIPPYSQTNVYMNVYAPENIQPGNYYAGLYITYENTTITKELAFRAQEINALGGLFAGLRLLYDNGYLVLLALSVLIIMVIRVVRTRRRYEYKEDVSDTLSEIKGIVFRRK